MKRIEGACHCGRIRYCLQSRRAPGEFKLRECDCGYCVRFRGNYASDPEGELGIVVSGPVTPYRHGTKTAEFYVCATCGIMPVAVSRIEGRDYAVVNARCAEAFVPYLASARLMSFGSESTEQRLARRIRSWICMVTIDRHGSAAG